MYRLRLNALLVACIVVTGAIIAPRGAMAAAPFTFIGSWPSEGLPCGLLVGPTGTVYMTDEYNGIGLRLFSQGGVPMASFNPGGAIESYGIGILSDQSIVFTSYYGNQVFRYSPGGVLLSQFGTGGQRSAWIAVDESDNIYVTDDPGDVVRKFSSSGALLAVFAVVHPAGVAYANGKVYITEMFNGHIQVFSPTGAPLGSFANGATMAEQLTASGNLLYLGDHGTHQLKCFSTDGTPQWTLGPAVPGYPPGAADLFSVAQASDGTLFVGDFNLRNVLIFVPTPTATVRNTFGALKARYRGEAAPTER